MSSLLKEDGLVALGGDGWQLCEVALKKLVLSQEKQSYLEESKRLLGEAQSMQSLPLKKGVVRGQGTSKGEDGAV
jgi:hypothetical protein